MYEELAGKRLLVLGGTILSCEIIRKAKQMGLTVAVTDYYPLEKSPGKQIADEIYDISTIDVDAVVQLIQKQKFDGVITGFSDMLLPYYAEICQKAGVPAYGTKEQFDIFTNKASYKDLCRKFGVPTVEEYSLDGVICNNEGINYPVLVKPLDGSGSRGISRCYTQEELNRAIYKALSCSKESRVLVERYMTGREVTVFWLFIDGNYYLTGIGDRHVKKNQGDEVMPLPVGYTFPSNLTHKYRQEIEPKVKEMLQYVGIKNGMMFMQCKVENDVCVIYDIGYRLTGSLEYINFAQVCGYNPLEMMIRFAVTGVMTDRDITQLITPETMKPSFNVSCLAGPGTIKQLIGCEKVKTFPEVADVVIAHYPGETIEDSMRGLLTQITVRVLGSVDNKKQLYQVMHKIEESIHIISTKGEEMRLSGIEVTDIDGLED